MNFTVNMPITIRTAENNRYCNVDGDNKCKWIRYDESCFSFECGFFNVLLPSDYDIYEGYLNNAPRCPECLEKFGTGGEW